MSGKSNKDEFAVTTFLERLRKVPSESCNLPMAMEAELAVAADEIHALARSLESAGCTAAALHLYEAASSLDHALPPRSGWWSEPFNGQIGRRELFLRLLAVVQPAAVVETGTFHGTTTAFVAEHFDGPIFTCEIDRRWFLSAQTNLERYPNVQIRCQDLRAFAGGSVCRPRRRVTLLSGCPLAGRFATGRRA